MLAKMKLFGAVVLAGISVFPISGFSQSSSCDLLQTTPEQFAYAQKDLRKAERGMKVALTVALRLYIPDVAERAEVSRMGKVDRLEQVRYQTTVRHDLMLSQQAWSFWRKTACKAVLDRYKFGTAGPVAEVQCKAAITRDRAAFLHGNFGQTQ